MADSLYRGCSVPARLPFIEAASKYIFERLALDIEDMGEMPCCIEPVGLRSLGHDTWSDVTGFICSKASGRIVTLCDGCTVSLADSVRERGSGPEISGIVEILHENIGRISESIVSPVGMKLAVFPGCHCEAALSRKGKDAVRMMSDIVEAIGGTPVVPGENLCCGGGLTSIDDTIAKAILQESADSFRSAGASAAVTSCPFCFMQFDMVARFRTYNIAELTAKAMGWDADTERYHRAR